ncbi:MAG: class I SAM-dependent methyltransferase [Deltaproteobacteria bacterium]|nr:class I SAM-dependent methyltransferase [Deltaproteobacteria bacterium]
MTDQRVLDGSSRRRFGDLTSVTPEVEQMRRPAFIARQSGCPSGLLGRIIGSIMATETAAANDAVVAALALQPTDHVLEIGFGHGRTLDRVGRQLTTGLSAGIDLSETMVRMAARRCRDLITAGRVTLHQGDSAQLPFPDGHFNKVYSVHTLYFWPEPARHLREIHRILRPGGCFVLGFSPRDDENTTAKFPAAIYRFYTGDEVRTLLEEAEFQDINMIARSVSSRTIALAVSRRG